MIRRVIVFCVVSMSSMQAQNIYVNETEAITKLMNNYMRQNHMTTEVDGWRIQIITTGDRRKSEAARDKFRRMYPHINQEWKHESPYYRVKVGGWNRKLDMQIFLQEIKDEFPLAIPVVDKIEERDILNSY